jgi:hypothetical protein
MVGGVKGSMPGSAGEALGVDRPEATRIAPAANPIEEGRALRDARHRPGPPAGAHGVLVADGGERLVEEEEHGHHLGPEAPAPHRAYGAT